MKRRFADSGNWLLRSQRLRYLVTKHRIATAARPEYRCDCPAFRFRPVSECKHIISFKQKEQGK